VLLSEEAQLGGDLIRAFGRVSQATLEVSVFVLDGRELLVREQVRRPVRRLERFQPIFGGQRAAAESGELLAKIPHELLELAERYGFMHCAV
jgi:hypothetical protein